MIPWGRFVVVLCVPVFLGYGQPASSDRMGGRTWVGRYQEIEDYLRTAECVSLEMFGASGLARCTLRPGGPVARMVWKPLPPGRYRGFWESYKSQIAAYEVDKLLKMDMVPPAVERQLDGRLGSAQMWVESTVAVKNDVPPDPSYRTDWENQLVRMTMFDNLIGNRDRNTANMLHDGTWNLILLDHVRAFGVTTELPHKLTRIDEALWARMESLTRAQLDAALRAWLGENEITAILERREKMKSEIRTLPGGPS